MNKLTKDIYNAGYIAGMLEAQRVSKYSSKALIQLGIFNFLKGLKK